MILTRDMMRPLSRTVLFSLLSAGLLPLSLSPCLQTAQAQTSASPSDGDKEMSRRRMAIRDAMLEVQEGRNAYAAGRYTQAEEHYRNALAVIPKVPATEAQVAFIRQSLADALIAKAMDYRKVGRNEEARSFLLEAIQLDPANDRAKQELAYTEDPTRNNPALSPQHVANVAEVQRLLELGYGYYDLGEFDKAIEAFQAVLRIDPYNTAARRGIEAVHNRRSAYYNDAARPSNRAGMLAEVDRQWEEQVPDPDALPEFGAVDEGQGVVAPIVQRDYAERLDAMVMPSIVFDGANILEVVEALQNQVLRFESSEGAAGGRHINITTNFGSQDSPAYKNLMSQEIRLNLAEVSIKDVLDLLCEQLGIQYYYSEIGVELCLGGRDSGPMMDRVFVVPPHFFDGSKGEDDDDDDDDGFAADSVSVGRINPKQTLMAMGITFPEGSSVTYSASTRLLRVRNTAQNLQDIETALDVPMEKDCQVVLSVIAVEVSQEDLEQLGFDWLFNISLGHGSQTYASGGTAQTAASGATGAPIFTAELGRDASPNMTSGLRDAGALRSSNDMEGLIQYGAPASFSSSTGVHSPSIFGVRGVWTTADVTFVMRGLSQSKGVDVLQNPKIVFSPGNEEQIAFGCVQEMYFPETWEQGEVQTTNNNRNNNRNANDFSFSAIATGAHPTDFVRMGCVDDEVDGIGTTLVIHSAELEETAEGTFINIALTTTVKEFEGFINWGSPINSVVINQRGDVQHIQLTPNYILQPMIKQRRENTNIRIAPGSVIVIGGLKEARSIQFEDKIPVLGDLPLVGRLFRSSGETQMRKALIFFVRVDYVDPTGRSLQTGGRPSSEQ